jgi:hypothetical protein
MALLFEIRFYTGVPGIFLQVYNHALALHKTPRTRKVSCNVALAGGSGAALANSSDTGGALGRVGARGGVYAHLGLVCTRSWSGGATGSGAR